jgi:hypothetical protein
MFNLDSIENRITDVDWLQKYHDGKGGHSAGYHQWVFDRVTNALSGKTGEEALDALRAVLRQLREEIMANPHLLKQ